MKKLVVLNIILLSVLTVILTLTGCSTEHMAYLDKTIYQEDTQNLSKDLAKVNKETTKDSILANIANGKSQNLDFTKKKYMTVSYMDLVNRDELWCIKKGLYKGLTAKEQMQFLRDVYLIINDSTNDTQQIYSYCDKIAKKYGYRNTDLVVNTNLLYESMKENNYKEPEIEKGKSLNIEEVKLSKKNKKKYKKMLQQIRSGKIGETTYKTSTYTYLEKGCTYYISYLRVKNKDKNHLIDTETFEEMTEESRKNLLTDICVLVNRQSNLKYYGKKNQDKLETSYKEYILSIIKADTGVDASDIMKETWNGDTREKAILDTQ